MGPTVGAVIRRLRARRGKLERAVLVRVRAAVPNPAGDGDGRYEAVSRAAVTAAVELTLGAVEELAQVDDSRARRLAEQVQGLLAGGLEDRDRVARALLEADLDYDLEGEHLGVIASGIGAEELLGALAQGLGRRLLSVPRGDGTVWAWLGGRHALKIEDFADALAALKAPADVRLAAGEPGHGLEEWRLTHRQARAAQLVAVRQSQPLTRYGEVALLAAVLKDELLARSLLDMYLAPLAGARGGGLALRRTLRAYLATERNVSSTAQVLNVARSTVVNRLHAVEDRLGRPLHACPAELEVALRLDALGSVTDSRDTTVVSNSR